MKSWFNGKAMCRNFTLSESMSLKQHVFLRGTNLRFPWKNRLRSVPILVCTGPRYYITGTWVCLCIYWFQVYCGLSIILFLQIGAFQNALLILRQKWPGWSPAAVATCCSDELHRTAWEMLKESESRSDFNSTWSHLFGAFAVENTCPFWLSHAGSFSGSAGTDPCIYVSYVRSKLPRMVWCLWGCSPCFRHAFVIFICSHIFGMSQTWILILSPPNISITYPDYIYMLYIYMLYIYIYIPLGAGFMPIKSLSLDG